jgi:hypothetical protein
MFPYPPNARTQSFLILRGNGDPLQGALENFQTPEVSENHLPKRFIVSSSTNSIKKV